MLFKNFYKKIHLLCIEKEKTRFFLKVAKKRPYHVQPAFTANIDCPFEPMVLLPKPLNFDIECTYETCGCRSNNLIWASKRLRLIYFENPKCGSSSIKYFFNIKQPDEYDIIKEFIFLLETGKTNKTIIYSESKKKIHNLLEYAQLLLDKTSVLFKSGSNHMLPYASPSKSDDDFQLFYGSKELVSTLFKGYSTFSFVRNPWDKMVSNWAMFTQKRERINILENMFKVDSINVNFNNFIKLTLLKKNHHWESQMKYIPKDWSKLDFVGKVENFDIDFGNFVKKFGYEYSKINKNKTDRESYSKYYDNETKNIVGNIFKKEIEAFGYRF